MISLSAGNNGEGGSGFFDRSSLYNAQAEHHFNFKNN
jgi:hypothetical protein